MSHWKDGIPITKMEDAEAYICVGKTGVRFWACECEIPINIQVKMLSRQMDTQVCISGEGLGFTQIIGDYQPIDLKLFIMENFKHKLERTV